MVPTFGILLTKEDIPSEETLIRTSKEYRLRPVKIQNNYYLFPFFYTFGSH